MIQKLQNNLIVDFSTPLLYGPITHLQIAQNDVQLEKFLIEGYKLFY